MQYPPDHDPMENLGGLRIRRHGNAGPTVIVLHGGPAAVGSAAPLARGLAGSFRVIEPWQRGSGDHPLTVFRHVDDLHGLVTSRSEDHRPALVGESWGAMLALAYGAAYPEWVGPLVLVGCGTFDSVARARMQAILEERTTDELRRRLDRLAEEYSDPAEQLRKRHELMQGLYTYELRDDAPAEEIAEPLDIRAHNETWTDMLKLQEAGIYPAAFAAITGPVLMLYGTYDPHPGRMIRASLLPYIPHLTYREWDRCGHRPWREKHVHGEFFALLRAWLARQMGL